MRVFRRHASAGKLYRPVLIDPELAHAWLATRKDGLNIRRLRRQKIAGMVNDLTTVDSAGVCRWDDNGEPIIMSGPSIFDCGQLLDGQHRLIAIEEAKVQIEMDVCFGIRPEAMSTIDTGSARNFADLLRQRHVANATIVSGIVRRWHAWQLGHVINPPGRAYPTVSKSEQLYREHSDLISYAARRGYDIYRKTSLLPQVAAGFFSTLILDLHYDQANAFLDHFIVGPAPGHPVHALRQSLMGLRATKYHDYEKLALCINAWNAWRRDQPVQDLSLVMADDGRTTRTELTNENFPIPI